MNKGNIGEIFFASLKSVRKESEPNKESNPDPEVRSTDPGGPGSGSEPKMSLISKAGGSNDNASETKVSIMVFSSISK